MKKTARSPSSPQKKKQRSGKIIVGNNNFVHTQRSHAYKYNFFFVKTSFSDFGHKHEHGAGAKESVPRRQVEMERQHRFNVEAQKASLQAH